MAERRLTLLLDDQQDKDILEAFDNAGKGVTKLGRRRLNIAYLIEEAGVFDQLEFLMKQGIHKKASAFEVLEKAIQITKMIQDTSETSSPSNGNSITNQVGKSIDTSKVESTSVEKTDVQTTESNSADSVIPGWLGGSS
ncbi:hypothetical protein H0A36_17665 [Endozoicomonas sp. SM1973]|uniref:Uncharacterized protein n=1 Tax=Spartinivicinus marinus TaxID=2994442 RepID=A0A853IFA8_9GAMM|nr:hypothetical protein [Spartinivicinus marinus]MCX4030202.1 hypothetical protein [Spartinivicinus marinus]NYZ67845.1 hypothetical protein [Spartinivicinus marinus]